MTTRSSQVAPQTRGVARWVLLRHTLPDGSWHFDWMVEQRESERAGSAERSLMTFRVIVRIDDPSVVSFAAARLEDHRNVYLDYEGPVSGSRGGVARVASGGVASVEERDGTIMIGLDVGAFLGHARGGGEWIFHREIRSA